MLASIAGMDVILADIVGSTTAELKPYLIGALVLGPALAGVVVYGALGGFGDERPDEVPPDGGFSGDRTPPDDETAPEEGDE
jgi:cytochrome b-561